LVCPFDETPGGEYSSHFGLRNLAIAYDMIEYAKMRYNMLGQAVSGLGLKQTV